MLAQVDIAYIGWQRVPIYRFGIAPNKLMDYMMAGRAVLHSVEAGNDPVAEAGCGVTVAPQDARAVANGLLQDDAAGAGGARGDGRARARVRAGAPHLPGAGEALPGRAGRPAPRFRRVSPRPPKSPTIGP